MTNRQLLYKGLAFLSLVAFLFFLIVIEVKGDTPILTLIRDLLMYSCFLFSTLWLRNLSLIIALILYTFVLNLDLLTYPLFSFNAREALQAHFSLYSLISSLIALALLFIAFSEKKFFAKWTKEVKFKDTFFVILLMFGTLIFQILFRVI